MQLEERKIMIRILVTGFGAFPGAPSNPTQAIVGRLATRHNRSLKLAGIDMRTAILPVAYGLIDGALTDLMADEQPHVVLHLGLAARRKVISIETRARNRLSTVHPDASGRRAPGMHVLAGQLPVVAARWPSQRLATAIARGGFPVRCSIDAGDYLCNQALYLSLGKHPGLCGFLHVPKLRKKWRRENPGAPGADGPPVLPTLDDVERSVLAAIRFLAVEHRRQRHVTASA